MARKKNYETLTIEDARIIFRNFSANPGKFDRGQPRRTFGLVIEDDKLAATLSKDGWNVKTLEAREEGDKDLNFISVEASYKIRPPQVALITSKGMRHLNEETINTLDHVDIEKVDVSVTPSYWEMNGETGIKAYLKTIVVTAEEDELMAKYMEKMSKEFLPGIDDEEDGYPFQ